MNRYVVTLDAYLWAESDKQAKRKAKKYAAKLNELDDCRPSVIGLWEQPFGTLTNRAIPLNRKELGCE